MPPPFFDSNRTRQINLGGSTTTTSHASILDGVKARRNQKLDAQRRAESALRIQAWYRGRSQARYVRARLRAEFDAGNQGIAWTRCLVAACSIQDQERLGRWSNIMKDRDALLSPFNGPDQTTWRTVIKRVLLLILKSVELHPESVYALDHLIVLNTLTDIPSLESISNPAALGNDIISFLVSRGLYTSLSGAFRRIPLESKKSPSLPLLITLATAPFSFPNSPVYLQSLQDLLCEILTIPLFPNRLSIPSVTYFSSRLPFTNLVRLDLEAVVASLEPSKEACVHLLANLLAFGPARIPSASAPTLNMYLKLLTLLMDSLPPGSLEAANEAKQSWVEEESSDSDDDDDVTRGVAKQFVAPKEVFALEPKTLLRLQTLWSPAHLNALLTATTRHPTARAGIFGFLISLWTVWPRKKERVMSTVIGGGGLGLTKEVYRGWVRSSPLGKEEDPKKSVEILTNAAHASSWPPFLFLTELYTHTLLTMGDDEFFSTSPNNAPGNSLSLDELVSFSRQLLNIAFSLYWHEDQAGVKEANLPSIRMKWQGVREKVTRCLQAIHARDSRRQFTPEDHWLVTSQIDLQSFVDAAVAEEQQLDRVTGTARTLSKRQMAFISPRLGVLNNIPFAIPFSVRVQIFRQFIANDAHALGLDDWYARPKHKATIRRGHVAEDGFDHLGSLGAAFKERVSITFIDEWGNEEAGIDGGGVFKEFLTSLTKEAFDTERGLWLATARQELYPNPHSYAKESHQLNWYRFLGRVLGKALYEGILIDVGFASFLLGKWLGKQSHLDDLQSLDPELYQGLVFLKHYKGNPEELSLNFTVTDDDLGVARTIDLIPNGSNISVTRENRIQYIYLVAHYRLNVQIKQQSQALFEGVAEMIDPKWLRMFNQQELQILIGGVEEPIDVDDLMQSTIYGGVYDDSHPTIRTFWKVVKSLDQTQRQSLIRFVTSCSRPPLLGFKELNPRFAIRDGGADQSRLPTSSTCVNLLKLPMYADEGTLRQKLVQAISSNAGFDLS